MSRVKQFEKAKKWIARHTIDNKGIAVTSKQRRIYPEVTGYYIPTLLEWGERDLAKSYAKYLCSIQRDNGAWYDSDGRNPYIFDTAQILKGLIAVYSIMPEVKGHIINGCEWLLSRMTKEGRLQPEEGCFQDVEGYYTELVHVYCLTPLRDAGRLFGELRYERAASKIKDYYVANYRNQIVHFSLLSHFYAYVLEGLLDMGETSLVCEAMENIESFQNGRGGIPGLNNVNWVCSTGMFQLALVWYKLGDLKKGDRVFYAACAFQNSSGGWYGCYSKTLKDRILMRIKKGAYYFPQEEISWAVKYFLDALAERERLEFENQAPIFLDKIEERDGRYLQVKEVVEQSMETGGQNISLCICDIGCGKGRYLKNLITDMPQHKYFAMDLSENVMKNLEKRIVKESGRITNIPYEDEMFDVVYVCEALEHAINIEGALNELFRILKRNGILLIIDKPIEQLRYNKIAQWEQYMDDRTLKSYGDKRAYEMQVVSSISYEDGRNDGLFRGWIFRKRLF